MPIDRIITASIQDGAVVPADLSTGAPTWDTSGNVGIGTSSPGTRLQLGNNSNASELARFANTLANFDVGVTAGGCQLYTANNQPIVFSNNAAERLRIDTSGNLLVGATATIWDERLGVRTTANTVVGGFYSTSTSYTSSVIRAQAETAAGTGWYLFEGRAATGSFQYGIRGNGTVATSDARRKKNIEPARSYLQDICSIPIVKYNWKSDDDGAPKELGWLAQDVEKVFPNMVVTHYDGPNDDQEVLLLKKEVFVPMLMKCIQEQQQMIEELKAKVAALEAK
jgi:hypothetical protein